MDSINKNMVFLILQYLGEEKKYNETARMLEQQSGLYFNMEYFKGEIMGGNFKIAEKYLSGFTKVDDNRYSTEIFFEIRKQNYYEALDEHEWIEACNILDEDLEIFASTHKELFEELGQLLTLNNFRDHNEFSDYGDTMWMRRRLWGSLQNLFKENPIFQDKLQFPTIEDSRLITMINQSLNWQHLLCESPKPDKPDIETLFVDHTCGQPTPNATSQPAERESKRVKTEQVSESGPSNSGQQSQNPQS